MKSLQWSLYLLVCPRMPFWSQTRWAPFLLTQFMPMFTRNAALCHGLGLAMKDLFIGVLQIKGQCWLEVVYSTACTIAWGFERAQTVENFLQLICMNSSSYANMNHYSILVSNSKSFFFFFTTSPTPHLSWVKVTENLPKDKPVTDKFGKVLKIENVSAADEGTYQCMASNPVGRAKHEFHVHVEGEEYILLSFLFWTLIGDKWEVNFSNITF